MSGIPLNFDDAKMYERTREKITRYEDIPGILSLKIPPVEYIVPALGIARKSVVIWCGQDGSGKTYGCQALAVSVSRGDAFLGACCVQCPVLYLDFENPAHTVQDRFQILLDDDTDPPLLKVWGIWETQQPPRYLSDVLIEIVRQVQPLVIIDTFRSFHDQKENESDGMAGVMTYLRALAEYGGTILLLHHPSKSEGSNGRGSSVIHASCDVAIHHSLDPESNLITLKLEKNRNGARRSLTVRADFENGKFEATDSPFVTTRNDDLEKLKTVITQNPGSTQNRVCELAGLMRSRAVRLLKSHTGKLWTTEIGPNKATLYHPHPNPNRVVLNFREPLRTTGPLGSPVSGGSVVLPPIGGNHPNHPPDENHPSENHREPPKTLPSCSACRSFCLYRRADGVTECQTCGKEIVR